MPTSKQALESFLTKQIRPAPPFKGASPSVLWAEIYRNLGGMYPDLRTEPRRYQLEGLAFALFKKRALLFYDTRLGKSKMALDFITSLKQSGQWQGTGIIIVHSPIGLNVWEGEVKKHSDLSVRSVHTKPQELIDALTSECDLVLIPWSGLQSIFSMKRVGKRSKKVEMVPDYETINIAAQAFTLAIIDEIHLAKDNQSLRFQIGNSLIQKCTYRLGMTGTPVGRDLYKLWPQVFLVDGGMLFGKNYLFFREAFGKEKPKLNWFTKRKNFEFDPKKEPLLQQWMQSISLSYKREEIHEVNILTNIIELEMTEAQLKAYTEAVDHLIKLHSGEDVEIEATFTRLRQISSGYLPYVTEDGIAMTVHFPNSPKLAWIADLAENMPDDVQAVIFCEFIHSGELLTEILQKAKRTSERLYGGTKNRNQVIKNFQTQKTQFLVANSVSGGISIDLKGADYVLFYESPVSPIIRAQAATRPMARGEKLLMVDDLVCSSIERKILGFIEQGQNAMNSLTSMRKSLLEEHKKRTLRKRPV
jgi:SNF2 family DNA or RNA helicase